MNRNVSIVVILLVFVVIAGYLVWLRSKVTSPVTVPVEQVQVTPTAVPTIVASASATPLAKEATSSTKQKAATAGAVKK